MGAEVLGAVAASLAVLAVTQPRLSRSFATPVFATELRA